MTDPTAQPGGQGGYGGDPNMPPPPPLGPEGAPAGGTSGNIFGILALIAGIVSIVVCCIYGGLWAGIPAIVLGVVGRKKADAGQATNRTLATVGLVLGIVGLVLTVGLTIAGSALENTDWYQNLPAT